MKKTLCFILWMVLIGIAFAGPQISGGGGGSSSSSGDVATDSIWTAKGQVAVGTGTGTAVAVGAGTQGYMLSVDAGEASGLKYALPSDLNIASQTAGDILYFDGTNWVRFAKGAANTILGISASSTMTWASSISVPAAEIIISAGTHTHLTAAQVSNSIISNIGQGAVDLVHELPAAAAGLSFVLSVGTTDAASNHFGVQAAANDCFYLIGSDGSITKYADARAVVFTVASDVGQSAACWTFCTGLSGSACNAWDWQCKAIAIGGTTFADHAGGF